MKLSCSNLIYYIYSFIIRFCSISSSTFSFETCISRSRLFSFLSLRRYFEMSWCFDLPLVRMFRMSFRYLISFRRFLISLLSVAEKVLAFIDVIMCLALSAKRIVLRLSSTLSLFILLIRKKQIPDWRKSCDYISSCIASKTVL